MQKIFAASLLSFSFVIYTIVVYTEGTKEKIKPKVDSRITEGKLLFQKHNCISCHQLYGLGGYLGPELTTLMSQQGKGEQYARMFLKYGGPRMPSFNLNHKEIDCLIEYLRYVDATAITYKSGPDEQLTASN